MDKIKPYKILIVDDAIDYIKTITDCVVKSREPYILFQALTGELALKIAKIELPDLIITDWEMPGMDGIQLIREIKLSPLTKDIPVIMCTGVMTTSENLHTALKAGAVDYIRKPIDAVELIARIQATLRLSESYKEIIKLVEIKNKVFSIIAHDLRGPVGMVNELVEVLLDEDITIDEFRQLLTSAKSSVGATFGLLENLLHWANSQRQTISVNPKELKLKTIISNSVILFAEQAHKKSISITTDTPEEHRILADENLFTCIMRNLISNAIKFTTIGGNIHISTYPKEDFVGIEVKDNGIGMTAEILDKILLANEHITTRGTAKEKGAGLGLRLCKEFVELNRGQIKIESKPGKGTSVQILLPLSKKGRNKSL
jgi:two-component system, sensor histidine kinase and response regulator